MDPVPLRYRLLLIGLMPVIAVVLYVRGQNYDPALIDFKTSAGGASAGPAAPSQALKEGPSSPVVQEIVGFRQVGRHQYSKDNLYEHVDGHAEYFISAGFVGLTVTEYAAAGLKAEEANIQAEVYDMGKDIHAFGVLTDESGDNPSPVSVGSMGFKTSGGLNFIKGRYYVKISAFSPKAPVLKFARGFSETLPEGQGSFKVFSKLPDLGKVENTRFVKEGYRGLDFARNVIEREYSSNGKKITVALMTGGGEDIRLLAASFSAYFKKSGFPVEKVEMKGNKGYKVIDKYEGNWFFIQFSDSIFCIFGTDDEEVLKHFGL